MTEADHHFQREINILQDNSSDKLSKRRAIEKIYKSLREPKANDYELLKPLASCLNDSVEKVRELSIESLLLLIQNTSGDVFNASHEDAGLAAIIPKVANRLGQQQIVEPAEEIRLQLLKLLSAIADKVPSMLAPFADDYVAVLSRTFLDPFPDVRKHSANLLISITTAVPRALTHHAVPLAKIMVQSLTHRHAAVRSAVLKAIGNLALVDASVLDEVMTPLQSLLDDSSPSVRHELYNTTALFLTKLPDRWSLAYKTFPILLAGSKDDVEKERTYVKEQLDQIAALYEYDWEDRLKLEIDFASSPSNASRARPGLRHLTRDHLLKMSEKIVENMSEWTSSVRIHALRTLSAMLPFAEITITGYIGHLLPPLMKILSSSSPVSPTASTSTSSSQDEVSLAKQCCVLLGKYVDPSVWTTIVIPQIKVSQSGSLRAIHGLIEGSTTEMIQPHFSTVLEGLETGDVITENIHLTMEAIDVLQLMVSKITSLPEKSVVERLVLDCVKTLAIAESLVDAAKGPTGTNNQLLELCQALTNKLTQTLEMVTKLNNLPNSAHLLSANFQYLITNLKDSKPEFWNRYSIQPRMVHVLGTRLGTEIAQPNVFEWIVDIVRLAVAEGEERGKEKDVDVKIWMLNLFLELIPSSPTVTVLLSILSDSSQSSRLLSALVYPSIIWRPGKRIIIVRRLALELIHRLLSHGFVNSDELSTWFGNGTWRRLCEECLEETEWQARRAALFVTKDILAISSSNPPCRLAPLSADHYKQLYAALLKRLDDANDSLRVLTCQVLEAFFESIKIWHREMDAYVFSRGLTREEGCTTVVIPVEQSSTDDAKTQEVLEIRLDDVHWDTLVKGITVHLDDTNDEVQNAVCSAMKRMVVVSPKKVVAEHLTNIRSKHRSTRLIDEVIACL